MNVEAGPQNAPASVTDPPHAFGAPPAVGRASSLWARTFGPEDTGDPSDVPGQPRCIRGRKRSLLP